MTKEQIDKIPRKKARELLASIPAGRGYDDRVLLAVEEVMNLEWWRGYHAAYAVGLLAAGKEIERLRDVVSTSGEPS